MSLHPDIIDAMVAAGASAGMDTGAVLAMVQAACRAAWNVAQQISPVPPVPPVRRETPRDTAEEMRSIAAAMRALDVQRDATDAPLHATVQRSSTGRPQTSTERSRKHRAAKSMQRATVSTALRSVASVAPLSLDLSLKAQTASKAKNSGKIALPDDWQPDDKSKAIAIEAIGESAAAALTCNFRDHYGSRPADQRTPAEWQATYRKWARSERKAAGGAQGRLPLMRKIGDSSGHLWKLERSYQETMARRRESG
jgi:hypothetical protein